LGGGFGVLGCGVWVRPPNPNPQIPNPQSPIPISIGYKTHNYN